MSIDILAPAPDPELASTARGWWLREGIKPRDEAFQQGWRARLASMPSHVAAVAEHWHPYQVYKIRRTGERCAIFGWGEHDDSDLVTVHVVILRELNPCSPRDLPLAIKDVLTSELEPDPEHKTAS